MPSITLLFWAILLSLFMILVASWGIVWLTFRLGLIDSPGSAAHKLHTAPKPVAGGLALLAVLLFTAWLFGTGLNRDILAAFIAALLVFAFGLWDDFRNLPPAIKLAGQVLGTLVLIYLGVYIRIFESPEFFVQVGAPWDLYLDLLLTVIWVVGVTNAFNFVDSMDGLAVGLGGIASGFFMLMALVAQQPQLALQCALMLGICAGLYFFNSPPAMFFLGDSGSQTLGFMLAVIAIVYRPVGAYQSSSWLVPILVLGMPIFDSALVILSRIRRRLPIYLANRDHTYHRLVALGMDSNHAVLAMHFAALLFGGLGMIALAQPPLSANAILGVCLFVGVLFIIVLDNRKRWL